VITSRRRGSSSSCVPKLAISSLRAIRIEPAFFR
jgi:hypothetical protein